MYKVTHFFGCRGANDDLFPYMLCELAENGIENVVLAHIWCQRYVEEPEYKELVAKSIAEAKLTVWGSHAPFGKIWDLDTPERKENAAEASGTWYVTAYNPFMNLYWDKPPYQLTLIYQNGRVITNGLTITDEGFSLTSEEGGGGYIPATEEEVQLTEDHG